MFKKAPNIGQKPFNVKPGTPYRTRNLPLAPLIQKAKLGTLTPLNLFAATKNQAASFLAASCPVVDENRKEEAVSDILKLEENKNNYIEPLGRPLNPETSFYTSKGKLIRYKVIFSKSKDTRLRKSRIQRKSKRIKATEVSLHSANTNCSFFDSKAKRLETDIERDRTRNNAISSIFEFLKSRNKLKIKRNELKTTTKKVANRSIT